jgi:CRISPR system Cascade subunit CasC
MLTVSIDATQFIPYSNVNADEGGAAKTVTNYGHTIRHRISSQAWKRVARHMVREENNLDWKLSPSRDSINEIIATRDDAPQDSEWADYVKTVLDGATDKGNVLGLFPESLFDKVVQYLIDSWNESVPTTKTAMKTLTTASIAYVKERILKDCLNQDHWFPVTFGSMYATYAIKHKAAFAMSDAIGVSETAPEVDFFTAVRENGVSGAATHLNERSRVTSVVYRHATINVDEIRTATNDLGEQVSREEVQTIVKSLINAFVKAFPTGQETSTAPVTLPFFVMVTVRKEGNPLNLSEAFLIPVTPDTNNDMRKATVSRIEEQVQAEQVFYSGDNAPIRYAVNTLNVSPQGMDNVESFDALANTVVDML